MTRDDAVSPSASFVVVTDEGRRQRYRGHIPRSFHEAKGLPIKISRLRVSISPMWARKARFPFNTEVVFIWGQSKDGRIRLRKCDWYRGKTLDRRMILLSPEIRSMESRDRISVMHEEPIGDAARRLNSLLFSIRWGSSTGLRWS